MNPLDALASAVAGRPLRVLTGPRPAVTVLRDGELRLGADLCDARADQLCVVATALLLDAGAGATASAAGLAPGLVRQFALAEVLRLVRLEQMPGTGRLAEELAALMPTVPTPADPAESVRLALDEVFEHIPVWIPRALQGSASRWGAGRRARLGAHSDGALALGPLARLAALLGGGQPTSVSGAGVDGLSGTTSWASSSTPPSAGRRLVAAADGGRVSDGGSAGGGLVLPEWDDRRGTYRPGWCRVHLTPPDPEASPPSVHRAQVRRIQRAFAEVGRGVGPVRPDASGDELDTDVLVRRQADVALGWDDGRDHLIWRGRTRHAPEVRLLFLVDLSSSVGGADGVDQQRASSSAAAILLAAEHQGYPLVAYGFRSYGRDLLITPVVHEGERASRTALSGFDPAGGSGFTRLGAALRFAAHRCADRDVGMRTVVLLVSDGFPFDEGYRGTHAEADVARAVEEATGRSVGLVWLRPETVDGAAERALADARSLVLEDAMEDPRRLAAVICQASGARRPSTGTPRAAASDVGRRERVSSVR